jgi:osmotically inducible protein OsmC
MKILYTAVATATGREGKASTSDGKLEVTLAAPTEMGGSGEGTNPEQLFATGYAACFASALGAVGRRQKVDTATASVTAEVGIGPDGKGGFGLAVKLKVTIPDVDRETGEQLVAAAHQVCPYSNATRGNIDVDLELV